jgi:hypothetical protein
VPDAIRAQIARGEAAEFILQVDDAGVQREAERFNAARGVAFDDAATLSLKSERYAARKRELLAALPSGEVEVLRDYDQLPLMFVRVRTTRALHAIVTSPLVREIHENRQNELPERPR